jgi:hypothetical protein
MISSGSAKTGRWECGHVRHFCQRAILCDRAVVGPGGIDVMRAALDPHPFARQASGKLLSEPPGLLDPQSNPKGDHEFEFDGTYRVPASLPKPAAVLVPVVLHDDEPTVLFTQRADNLRSHSGQIAFPGGRMDEDDDTPLVTALRRPRRRSGSSACSCVRSAISTPICRPAAIWSRPWSRWSSRDLR